MDDFEKILRKHDLRVTKPRQNVFLLLKQASGPLSISDIYKGCNDINRATIYRTIETCISIGVIKIVYIGWKKQYELTDLFGPHHHHLRCITCSALVHIENSELEASIQEAASREGYILTSHHFEIEGICTKCQRKPH